VNVRNSGPAGDVNACSGRSRLYAQPRHLPKLCIVDPAFVRDTVDAINIQSIDRISRRADQ